MTRLQKLALTALAFATLTSIQSAAQAGDLNKVFRSVRQVQQQFNGGSRHNASHNNGHRNQGNHHYNPPKYCPPKVCPPTYCPPKYRPPTYCPPKVCPPPHVCPPPVCYVYCVYYLDNCNHWKLYGCYHSIHDAQNSSPLAAERLPHLRPEEAKGLKQPFIAPRQVETKKQGRPVHANRAALFRY